VDSQTVLTALLVAACSAYAAWNVMPAALRRKLAAWAGRPQPATGGNGSCGGGCEGCGSAAPRAPAPGLAPGESVVRIVRQPPS
jgi:hypothetical protein